MDSFEKNTFGWINKNNKSSNQSSLQNYMSRIIRAAFASFADLFTDPKMS